MIKGIFISSNKLIVNYTSSNPPPPPSTSQMLFGTWYSRWCTNCNPPAKCGAYVPDDCKEGVDGAQCCPNLPSKDKNPMKMTFIEDMLSELKTYTMDGPKIDQNAIVNSAASLGIGANPSFQGLMNCALSPGNKPCKDSIYNSSEGWELPTALWQASMCGMTSLFSKLSVDIKICNIGGWGSAEDKSACSPWCSLGCNISMSVQSCPNSPSVPVPNCTGGGNACQQCANEDVAGALWRAQDIPSDIHLKAIAERLIQLKYQGISFDIEGMTNDFIENLNGGHNGGFLPQVGKLRNLDELKKMGIETDKPFQIWIILPGFNSIDGPDGSKSGQMPDVKSTSFIIEDHNNIDIVQLMIYGEGLDSNYAGDPTIKDTSTKKLCMDTTDNQTDNCIQQIIDGTIDALTNKDKGLSKVPANKKMLALSIIESDMNNFFPKYIKSLWKFANAGLFSWCRGEAQNWSWDCGYGTALKCDDNACVGKVSAKGVKEWDCPALNPTISK